MEAFTPSALPDFFVKPASIPTPVIFCLAPVALLRHTHRLSDSASKNSQCAWFVLCHTLLLDAVCDPGVGTVSRPSEPTPIACIHSQGLGQPNLSFGANYRIQRLTLHLATFPNSQIPP